MKEEQFDIKDSRDKEEFESEEYTRGPNTIPKIGKVQKEDLTYLSSDPLDVEHADTRKTMVGREELYVL